MNCFEFNNLYLVCNCFYLGLYEYCSSRFYCCFLSFRNVLNSSAPQLPSQPISSGRTTALPPLPPRPPQLSVATPNRSPYGMTPSMYGGGYSGYSGYGGYSSYGGYPGGSMYGGGGYGGYGAYGQSGSVFENR